MKIKLLLLTCLFLSTSTLFAQKVDYNSVAQSLKESIWLNPSNGFDLKTIPDSLKKESAVILARSYSTEASSKQKIKYLVITAAVTTQVNQITTYHERTLVNDKAAVENYSSLNYQKRLANNKSLGIGKIYDESQTYLGVKILKSSGKEIIVNTSEEVLLKNNDTEQKGKLAIPDLQPGDIIDYYICVVEKTELGKNFSETEVLNNEYHTLNYNYSYTFSDKFKVTYNTLNGCPNFTISTDNLGNTTYSLKGKDLKRKSEDLWVSPYRSYPFFEINPLQTNLTTGSVNKILSNGDGEISSIKKQIRDLLKLDFSTYSYYTRYANSVLETVEESFPSKKEFNDASLDTIMNRAYNTWRINNGFNLTSKTRDIRRNNMYYVYAFSDVLIKKNIPHELIFVSSRFWKPIDKVLGFDDLTFLLKVNTEKPVYLYFNNPYNNYGQIPKFLQGEDAYSVLQFKDGVGNNENYSKVKIPVESENLNVLNERLNVSILSDFKKISINRVVEETGVMKDDDDHYLLTKLDFYNALGKGKTQYDKDFKSLSKTEKDNATAVSTDEETDKAEYLKSLIQNQYDTKPEQISNTQVTSTGLTINDNRLTFSSNFVLNDFIQKAGNNFLLNAGKLIGTVSAVKEQERTRFVDVYMPSARVLSYFVTINIPNGYKVKGIENLTKEVSNVTGSFKSSAKQEGNVIKLEVNRVYHHNFEKAVDWPKLVSLLDAGYEFTGQKILFEKL